MDILELQISLPVKQKKVLIIALHNQQLYSSSHTFKNLNMHRKMGPSQLNQTVGALNPERKKTSLAGTRTQVHPRNSA